MQKKNFCAKNVESQGKNPNSDPEKFLSFDSELNWISNSIVNLFSNTTNVNFSLIEQILKKKATHCFLDHFAKAKKIVKKSKIRDQ